MVHGCVIYVSWQCNMEDFWGVFSLLLCKMYEDYRTVGRTVNVAVSIFWLHSSNAFVSHLNASLIHKFLKTCIIVELSQGVEFITVLVMVPTFILLTCTAFHNTLTSWCSGLPCILTWWFSSLSPGKYWQQHSVVQLCCTNPSLPWLCMFKWMIKVKVGLIYYLPISF
jgi:hypothetical protein